MRHKAIDEERGQARLPNPELNNIELFDSRLKFSALEIVAFSPSFVAVLQHVKPQSQNSRLVLRGISIAR
jgi:hypothetical protein